MRISNLISPELPILVIDDDIYQSSENSLVDLSEDSSDMDAEWEEIESLEKTTAQDSILLPETQNEHNVSANSVSCVKLMILF